MNRQAWPQLGAPGALSPQDFCGHTTWMHEGGMRKNPETGFEEQMRKGTLKPPVRRVGSVRIEPDRSWKPEGTDHLKTNRSPFLISRPPFSLQFHVYLVRNQPGVTFFEVIDIALTIIFRILESPYEADLPAVDAEKSLYSREMPP